MELIVIWAVVISAALHAIWNYFLKRSTEPNLFIGLSKMIEALLLTPIFFYFYQFAPTQVDQLFVVAIAAILVFLSYYFLSLTYQYLDMSLAYPISRASTLFLPFLAWYFLGQTVDLTGAIALILILLGVALLSSVKAKVSTTGPMDEKVQASAKKVAPQKTGILLALLVALIAAVQTLWAKIALNQLHPFIFFYSYTFIVALCYLGFTFKTFNLTQIKCYFKSQWLPITTVSVLNSTSYMLFLFALQHGNTAYVGSLRQLSLVVALLLGVWLLREPLGQRKLLGTAIVIAGSILITFAA